MKTLDEQLKDFKRLFLCGPNDQIDTKVKNTIKKWDKVPKAINILHTLDYAINNKLASDFVLSMLDTALKLALENESKKIG